MGKAERMKEIREAIDAGNQALLKLKEAKEKLISAQNWGIFDMFAGGLLVSYVKRSRIQQASDCISEAKGSLMRFKRELGDLSQVESLGIDVGGFLAFSDYFFDGVIVDYLVQRKISEAEHQVDESILKLESLLRELRCLETDDASDDQI